ncbi:MFS transporter [Streptomyces sp. NBC_01210]|uniref:MFS transporter n=1 Tax=Streptomyces sp. NBC_01210 TaxID=2903774 RepID=UPI002E14546F|nr:MFS transporter [Streptomyces sp. NBC_01210]
MTQTSERPQGLTTKQMLAAHPGLGGWRVKAFAATWLAYATYYFVREAPSVAQLGILEEGSGLEHVLTKPVWGVLDTLYLVTYAIGQFIWGACADRFGTRIVVIGGIITSIGAALVMGISPTVVAFGVAMTVLGFAQSTGWAPLCKNVSNFFTVKERGRVLGLWSTNYAFGGLASVPFLGWLAYGLFDSWKVAFFGGAAVMGIALLVFLVLQRNSPEAVGLPNINDAERGTAAQASDQAATDRPRPAKGSTLKALRDPMVLTLGAAYFLIKPARYAILLWGPIIVNERLPQVGKVSATAITIAFGVAGCLAPSLIGFVSDKVFGSRRVPPAVLSLVLLTIVLALFSPLTASGSVTMMIVVLGFMGLSVYAADSMISCTAAVDFGKSDSAGTAAGVVNGCGSVGAIFGGLLPGIIGGHTYFYLFAGAALLAALIMLPRWNRVPVAA